MIRIKPDFDVLSAIASDSRKKRDGNTLPVNASEVTNLALKILSVLNAGGSIETLSDGIIHQFPKLLCQRVQGGAILIPMDEDVELSVLMSISNETFEIQGDIDLMLIRSLLVGLTVDPSEIIDSCGELEYVKMCNTLGVILACLCE